MPIATPLPLVLMTSRSIGSPPPSGVQLIVSVPAPGNVEVLRAVLIAEAVAGDDHRLVPVRHEARHVLADDRLAEDRAVEDVADGAVRATSTSA